MPNIQLAKNLRYLRRRSGLSQKDLEQLLNITRQTFSNYENCKRTPDVDTLVRIAQLFHVSLDDLVLKNLRNSYVPFDTALDGSFLFAESEKTGNSIYLTQGELDLVTGYRSLPEEKRQIITGYLNYEKEE